MVMADATATLPDELAIDLSLFVLRRRILFPIQPISCVSFVRWSIAIRSSGIGAVVVLRHHLVVAILSGRSLAEA